MPLGDEHSLSSEELLAAGEQELVDLLTKYYHQSNKLDVPRIAGRISTLTADRQAVIRIKLKNASEKMDPVKAAEFNETLQSAFDAQYYLTLCRGARG